MQGKSKPSYEFIVTLLMLFPDIDLKWLLTGRSFKSDLEFKFEQINRENEYLKSKLGTIAKPYSNRVNPQGTIPGFGVELVRKYA